MKSNFYSSCWRNACCKITIYRTAKTVINITILLFADAAFRETS